MTEQGEHQHYQIKTPAYQKEKT